MNDQGESREEQLARLLKRDAEQDAEIERLRRSISAQKSRIAELEKQLKPYEFLRKNILKNLHK